MGPSISQLVTILFPHCGHLAAVYTIRARHFGQLIWGDPAEWGAADSFEDNAEAGKFTAPGQKNPGAFGGSGFKMSAIRNPMSLNFQPGPFIGFSKEYEQQRSAKLPQSPPRTS